MAMSYVATLIPSTPVIQPSLLEEMLAVLKQAGHAPSTIDWLAPGRVVDLYFKDQLPDELVGRLHIIRDTHMVDLIIQPLATRDKTMLISDMDSTMITVECIDELADYVGKKDQVAKITERAMNGELDFSAALNERVALLAGLPEEKLVACYDARVKFMPGAHELVAVMKKRGCYCLLVSGGFDFFTSRVASELGFDAEISNKLEIVDGKLTGKVVPPIFDKDSKLAALNEHAAARGIKHEEILAVGDGANDLPMLQASGLGVAYWAKPNVRAAANAHIDHNNLSALIYAQGLQL